MPRMNKLTDSSSPSVLEPGKPYRNRAAYNRALKLAREAYWSKCESDPDFAAATPWNVFRPEYIRKALEANPPTPRGRKPGPTQTARQKYQQVYQKARRQAEEAYYASPTLQSQFSEFAEYWKERKHTWLPPGFLKPNRGLKVKRETAAKDDRSAYQVVYKHHIRCWEGNIASCRDRFGTWARYWEFVKVHAFVPEGGDEPIDNGVVHDHFGFVAYSKIPPGWLGANASPLTGVAPITRPAAVYLETDVIANDSEWLVAA